MPRRFRRNAGGESSLTVATNQGNASYSRSYACDAAGNMDYNSGLGCGANPNITYGTTSITPRPAPASYGGPHSPRTICGVAVQYDANGNTTSYDPDGTGTLFSPKAFTYDGENRPLSITAQSLAGTNATNGRPLQGSAATTTFAYGPGPRALRADS